MFQSILPFFCILINIAKFQEVPQHHFYLVSTTQNPQTLQNEEHFFKKQLEFYQKQEETNRRLSTMETQILELQNALDEEKTKTANLSLELSRIKAVLKNHERRLEITEKLERTTLISSNIRKFAKSCKGLRSKGVVTSGIYVIQPKAQAFKVYCDMETKEGGWTVFQRRVDGSQNFNRTLADYKKGFGDLNREFWLGLEYLHQITESGRHELLVELVDQNQNTTFAKYGNFKIGSEEDGYSLRNLTGYEGTAGDSLSYHKDRKFVTPEIDRNCAAKYASGWWFYKCLYSNLNGVYFEEGNNSGRAQGINWYTFSTDHYSLLEARMMTRPSS